MTFPINDVWSPAVLKYAPVVRRELFNSPVYSLVTISYVDIEKSNSLNSYSTGAKNGAVTNQFPLKTCVTEDKDGMRQLQLEQDQSLIQTFHCMLVT